MMDTSFSYPLDRWVNEGGALVRDTSSAFAPERATGSAGTSRWVCRFSPRTIRRTYARNPRKFRRDRCVLKIR